MRTVRSGCIASAMERAAVGRRRRTAAALPLPPPRCRRRALVPPPLAPPPRPGGCAAHADRPTLYTSLGRFGWPPWAPPPSAEAKHPAVSLRTLQTLTTAPLGVCWAAPPTFQPQPSNGQRTARSPPGTLRAQATRLPHAAPTSGVRLCAPLIARHHECPGHPATAFHPQSGSAFCVRPSPCNPHQVVCPHLSGRGVPSRAVLVLRLRAGLQTRLRASHPSTHTSVPWFPTWRPCRRVGSQSSGFSHYNQCNCH